MAHRGHTWEGWDFVLHSLCQARWLLSLKGEEERWKEKGEGWSSESPLTALEWPVPRATTSGDHLLLAQPASSILIALAHAHFSHSVFPDGGGGGGGSGVFGQAACLYFSNFSVCALGGGGGGAGRSELRRDGKRRGRRWWRESIEKYHFIL